MFDFLINLFDTSDFPNRWRCGQWSSFHGWLHIVSDLAIFGAYITIPFVLLYFVRHRKDVPYPKVLLLFAAFVFCCGFAHLIEATIFWWPIYRVSASMKFLTAIVSWVTVFGFVRILPSALAMRSASELHAEISERQKTEEELRKSEMRFAAFMDNSPLIAWVKDNKGRHKYFSRSYMEKIGVPVDDWEEKTDFELWPKEIAESHLAMDRKVLLAGEPISYESNHPLPSGEARSWYVVKFPYNFDEHEVLIGGIAVDLTEQRMAESERDRFFETSSDLMCIINFDGHFTRVNEAFTEVLGYPREELLQQPMTGIIHGADQEETRAAIDSVKSGSQVMQFENRCRSADGSYRLVSWTAPALEANATAIFAVGRDITEQRSLEKSLLQVTDTEQRRIAHDLHDGLGQELAGVAMMANSLANKLKHMSIPAASLADRIAIQLDESLKLTRSLARGLRPVEIDSRGLESALTHLAESISLAFDVDCTFQGMGNVDLDDPEKATHLFRIAQEAVNNAARHGNADRIEIEFGEYRTGWELSISDDGAGIADHAEQGQGIGLKSMQYRSNLIGGRLQVRSGEHSGTIVCCKLDRETF